MFIHFDVKICKYVELPYMYVKIYVIQKTMFIHFNVNIRRYVEHNNSINIL